VCLSYLRDSCKFNQDVCKNDHQWYKCKHLNLRADAKEFIPAAQKAEDSQPTNLSADAQEQETQEQDTQELDLAYAELDTARIRNHALLNLLLQYDVSQETIDATLQHADELAAREREEQDAQDDWLA
jgi:hypothetical protein